MHSGKHTTTRGGEHRDTLSYVGIVVSRENGREGREHEGGADGGGKGRRRGRMEDRGRNGSGLDDFHLIC